MGFANFGFINQLVLLTSGSAPAKNKLVIIDDDKKSATLRICVSRDRKNAVVLPPHFCEPGLRKLDMLQATFWFSFLLGHLSLGEI